MEIDKTVQVAIVSAVSSIATVLIIKPFVDRRLARFQIKLNYKAEQSKKIKDLLGLHKGNLLKSAELLNNRLKNFSKNYNKEWLNVAGDYATNHYYLDSMVYRILCLYAYIKIIETKIIYLDATISQKSDLRLIKYFRVFHEIMCDVDLFTGLQYDNTHAVDHFFASDFDTYCTYVIKEENVISFDEFRTKKTTNLEQVRAIYSFFDGMNLTELRFRVERVKTLHLLVIAFLNEFGYDYQYTTAERIVKLKTDYGEYKLLKNFEALVIKYKLKKSFSALNTIISEAKV